MLGHHCLKSWSSTQAGVALSSCEAEFNGVVKGSATGLGYQSLLADLGITVPVRVWTDSSAAVGICNRQGVGKIRHLATHLLWVQQAVRCGRIDLRKIRGEVNPADIFTKHMASRNKMSAMVKLCRCEYRGGRATSAPLTRDGEVRDKVTMADANSLEDEEMPIMPHNTYNKHDLDHHYPSIRVPEECNTDADFEDWDQVYQYGLKIAEEIQYKTQAQGRRRNVG